MHYKFLNSADVDKVLVDGTIVVSSLGYFRRLEAGDIGDPLEGGTELTVRDAMTATEGSPALATLNTAGIGLGSFKQFAKFDGGGQISIAAGASFVHLIPELFIYSFSVGDLPRLTEEMCVNAKEPYDACVMIKDPAELGRACFHRGKVKNLGGRRVDDLFEDIRMKDVDYVARSIDITEGKVMEPDPFKKGERFRPQSEMRLVFFPRGGQAIPTDRLILDIPGAAGHFELAFRGRKP